MVRFVQVVSNEKIINSTILKANQKFIIWWFWRRIGNLAFGHFEAYWKFDHLEGQIELNWIECFFQFGHFEGRLFIIELISKLVTEPNLWQSGWPMESLKVCCVGLFIEFCMGPSTVCPSYTQEWMLLFVVRKGTNETIPHFPQAGWVRIPFLL